MNYRSAALLINIALGILCSTIVNIDKTGASLASGLRRIHCQSLVLVHQVLKKRAASQAFEVVIIPQSKEFMPKCSLFLLKKNPSLEEIQKNLEAAEERHRFQETEVFKQLAEKGEHKKEVFQKAAEEKSKCSKTACSGTGLQGGFCM